MNKDWFFNQTRLGNIDIIKDFVDITVMKQYYIYQVVDNAGYFITGPDFNWEFGWRLDLSVDGARAYKEYRFNEVELQTLDKIRKEFANNIKTLRGQIIEESKGGADK